MDDDGGDDRQDLLVELVAVVLEVLHRLLELPLQNLQLLRVRLGPVHLRTRQVLKGKEPATVSDSVVQSNPLKGSAICPSKIEPISGLNHYPNNLIFTIRH